MDTRSATDLAAVPNGLCKDVIEALFETLKDRATTILPDLTHQFPLQFLVQLLVTNATLDEILDHLLIPCTAASCLRGAYLHEGLSATWSNRASQTRNLEVLITRSFVEKDSQRRIFFFHSAVSLKNAEQPLLVSHGLGIRQGHVQDTDSMLDCFDQCCHLPCREVTFALSQGEDINPLIDVPAAATATHTNWSAESAAKTGP